jgi:hypothetical protein
MTERRRIDGWEVSVSINGENVLTIGHDHLSGIENIDDYADEVRNCAQHLLSFIGPASAANGEIVKTAQEE